jgi:hypothetical protein
MLHVLLLLIRRILLAIVFAVIVMLLPVPSNAPKWLVDGHIPVVVFVLVCYIGKSLYDTLFYNRYQP